MLVTYKNAPHPVGLAVTQWKIDGELRTFVLYPIVAGGNRYVEVDCATEDNPTIVKPHTDDWQKLDNGFGDDSYGYELNEETRDRLYQVWDDGAREHMQEAEELFWTYEQLINAYTTDAQKYLDQHGSENHRKRIEEAEKNGWDVSLAKKEDHSFPYVKPE